MGFDFALVPFKGWASAEVDGCGVESAVGEASPSCIDTIGREALVFGGEIGGRKAKSMSSTVSWDDLAKNSKGATQHGGGIDQFAFADGGADSAAADSFVLVEDGWWVIENRALLFAPSGEHGDIPRSVVAKAPVGANRNRL